MSFDSQERIRHAIRAAEMKKSRKIDAEAPKPSARVDGIFENAWWNRANIDPVPVLDKIRELRLIVARYDVFAAIWPDKVAPAGYGIRFFTGEDKADASGGIPAHLRPGFIMADDAAHAEGWHDALKIWKD